MKWLRRYCRQKLKMKQFNTEGLILRRTDYGEADRIITLLTQDFGKINVIAKGVRKQKSKLAGGIELFSISEIHFIKGRGSIDTLVSTRLIKYYDYIVKDYDRTQLAYQALKTIHKITEDNEGGEYFEIVNETLSALNRPELPIKLAELSFLVRLLGRFGHLPDFTVDVNGDKLDQSLNYNFDNEKVAFVHSENGMFNKNHIKLLKLLSFNSAESLLSIQGVNDFSNDLLPIIRNHSVNYLS